MPLVDVQVIEGVFDNHQKAEMIRKVTDAMVSIEGDLGSRAGSQKRTMGDRRYTADGGSRSVYGGR